MANEKKRIIDYPETNTVGDDDYLLMSQYNDQTDGYDSKKVKAVKVGGGDSSTTPYLKATGTQYIDTGVKPSDAIDITVEFFIDANQFNKTASWQNVFGGNDRNTINSLLFSFNQSASQITFQEGSVFGDTNSKFMQALDIHKVTMIDGICSLDGVVYQSFTVGEFESTHNVCLFASSTDGTVEGFASICITKCKIYSNNTLVRDFVPKVVNGTPCMYDNVHENAHYNAGTGDFIFGRLS